MKKSEMLAKAAKLSAQIALFEKKYKTMEQERTLDREVMSSISKELKQPKELLESAMRKIEVLRYEEAPLVPEHSEANDAIWSSLKRENQEYKNIPSALKVVETVLELLVKNLALLKAEQLESQNTGLVDMDSPERQLAHQQALYEQLMQSIQDEIDSDKARFISPKAKKDAELQESLNGLKTQQQYLEGKAERFKKEIVQAEGKAPVLVKALGTFLGRYSSASPKNESAESSQVIEKKLTAYREEVKFLKGLQSRYAQTRQIVHSRLRLLIDAETGYNIAVSMKDGLVAEGRALLKSAELRHLRSKDNDDLLEHLAGQISAKIVKKNDQADDGGDVLVQSSEATAQCNADADELRGLIEAFKKRVDILIRPEKEQITREIDKLQREFSKKSNTIKAQLKKASLTTERIEELEEKFNELNVKEEDVGITFLQEKLEALSAVSQALDQQIARETKNIRESFTPKMSLLNESIQEKQGKFDQLDSEMIKNFSSEEMGLYELVMGYPIDLKASAESNIAELHEQLEAALDKDRAFREQCNALEAVVERHKIAKLIADKIIKEELTNPVEFAAGINEAPEGGKLLMALDKYILEAKLTGILNNHLRHFDARGLAAIKEFVRYDKNNLDTPIKEKLAFIDLLTEAGIGYSPFLAADNSQVVIAAVLYLEEQGQKVFISEENMRNKSFCEALSVLERHGVDFTDNDVSSLVSDPNKCEIICQQDQIYKKSNEPLPEESTEQEKREHRDKLDEGSFKALLQVILKSGPQVTSAVHVVKTQAPEYCQHWLLPLVQENEQLQNLLLKGKDFESNLPFLKIIFSDAVNHNRVFLKDYLEESDVNRNWAVSSMQEALNKSSILEKLASKSAGLPLGKMGVVMKEINRFVEENDNSDTRQSLFPFRREAALVLLADGKLEEKQAQLEELADKHFKQTGLLGRALECIFNAFAKFARAEKVSKYKQYFFSTQKVDALDHIQKGIENTRSNPGVDDEQDADADLPVSPR